MRLYETNRDQSFHQVNFVFAHLVFILLSLIYKWLFTDSRTSVTTRHLYLIVPSLLFGYFCFGL